MYTKAEELRSFLFLTVVMAPALTGMIIAGYGFLVWMFQLIERSAHRRMSPLQRAMSEELHIAGIVVHVLPESVERVTDRSRGLPGRGGTCGQPRRQAGRDARGPERARDRRAHGRRSSSSTGVLSASLVYQHNESLEAMMEEVSHEDHETGIH